MERFFIKAPKEVFYCVGVVTPSGEMVRLLPVDKMIYFHMLDRKKLFTDRGGEHFESQETIADLLGVERKTVNRSMQKMLSTGLVFGHKQRHLTGGYVHWIYTGVNSSPVLYGNPNKQPEPADGNIESPF